MIPFNKPYLTGNEIPYIQQAVNEGKISGNGAFTKKCHDWFTDKYGFDKVLLTSSCTDALEMAAILLNIKPEDEVIIPSFTFVSTANAFVLRGAKLVFVDSNIYNPNLDPDLIEELINPKTKAIVVVHYAGIACNMSEIIRIAKKHNLPIIEDAAQGIDSYFRNIPLGKLGILSTFSFHETKNIMSGEGGMLAINDPTLVKRSEIIWEKGTNRAEFFRGEANKYGWVDIGSSFLPSEITAAFLYAQLEGLDLIQKRRKEIWSLYYNKLSKLENEGKIRLPFIPDYATNNAHMFYLVADSSKERDYIINHLKNEGFLAVFHYQSLHKSPYFTPLHDGRELPNSDHYSDCLIRLPLFFELDDNSILKITDVISHALR